MTHPVATYSFLPWLRQGLANHLTAQDGDVAVLVRAAVRVELQVTGERVDGGGTATETVARDVALFGPGDIVGIERRAIVRTEPRDWITNFEPNYLAHIEFYDEDFPWRYTPAAPSAAGRLRPWIALAVLTEDEFRDGTAGGRPAPYIEVADPAAAFPPAEQLWAWAHVHVNRGVTASETEIVSTDMGAVLPRLQGVLAENPDLAYSRIVCPRKLAPNQAYHAFLVPVFETGRLAGLGRDPAGSPHATHAAWVAYGGKEEPQSIPFYHRWYFRTGVAGDFESLVRLLEPRRPDARVGARDLDVRRPGSNLPGITDAPDDVPLQGVLRLGGALRVPDEALTAAEQTERDNYESWDQDYPHPFQEALARFINLSDAYAESTAQAANAAAAAPPPPPGEDPAPDALHPRVADDPDPMITPPLYGTWHALTRRLLRERDGTPVTPDRNWVHQLNLDPRHRVAAGFGTRVVQERQERYMDAAWEQVGAVLEANRRIRLAQLAREASWIWYERHLRALHDASPERSLALTAPLHRRVRLAAAGAPPGGFTVQHQLAGSRVQPVLLSPPARRVLRPRGRLLRSAAFDAAVRADNLLARVNAGEVSAAPPRQTPDAATVDQVADAATPPGAASVTPGALGARRRMLLIFLLLLLLAFVLVLLLAPAAAVLAGVALAALALLALALYWLYARSAAATLQALGAADAIRGENRDPANVDRLPPSPGFVLTEPFADTRPGEGDRDSPEAVRFKEALRGGDALLAASREVGTLPPRVRLDLGALALGTLQAVDPLRTIPARTWHAVLLPDRIRLELPEEFVEAMAYPEIDEPMYKPLADLSSELFLPNLNLIEPNSITLLETNQRFIEAYMVGLNHEFARELLWREFPTDQRGSYFRQFWDVKGALVPGVADPAVLRERLKDIPPLHLWPRASELGDHDHREQQGDKEEEVVLVIRGELLKRYPTAVIYAHHAKWGLTPEGEIDPAQERELEELTPAEEDAPPRAKLRTPLYEAKVDPDIYFFGFDLTAATARGGSGEDPGDDPGWFFVIKERPGEPRFGLDTDRQPDLNVWNDLAWDDVQPGPPGSHLQVSAATPAFTLVAPDPTGPEREKAVQYEDDRRVPFGPGMSAADLAYVLFQAPVLVAVHAAEMLREP